MSLLPRGLSRELVVSRIINERCLICSHDVIRAAGDWMKYGWIDWISAFHHIIIITILMQHRADNIQLQIIASTDGADFMS